MVIKKNVAFVFPGQGSQTVGMFAELAEKYSLVTDLFASASKILNDDLWKIVSNGPAEVLNQTIYTQPAMLVADVAMWYCWQKQDRFIPAFVAGHSLGEYAALVAAEAISFDDAVKLVVKRANFMQEAVAEDQGAMAVMLGLSQEQVITLCQETTKEISGVVEAVNFNAPGQIVIAGETQAVDKAMELAQKIGSRRTKKLPVSVPSHCQLMKTAANQLAKYLESVSIVSPKIPVVNNVDVAVVDHPDDIRDALVRQLYNPVRWIEIINKLFNEGINEVVECGPGKVLTGLCKRIHSELQLFNLNDAEALLDSRRSLSR